MSSSETPDSWDQREETTQPVAPMSKLNINAQSFVPGQNVFARSFAPTGVVAPTPTLAPVSGNSTESASASISTPDPAFNNPALLQQTETTEVSTSDVAKPSQESPAEDEQSEEKDEEYEDEEEDELDDEPMQAIQVAKVKKVAAELSSALKKEHVNIVFIGHVDAGKSTIGGRILEATGMVDKRTLEKYEREAKEKNRETWYLSWALDTNVEERDKGKTVEVGRAYFETENRHFTILDAPGHKSFVPNMIGGASQADIAVLVISARKGEFETGFERGGQTREHAMLVKTAGVKHLIILVNKMDDPTVEWEQSRFEECRQKLLPYLKRLGFNPKTDLKFIPCSGLTGAFIKHRPDPDCAWYKGETFLDYLEQLPPFSQNGDGPVRIPVVDRYKDMGTIVLGKIQSGQIFIGQKLLLMPNKREIEVMQIWSDDIETEIANSGENVKVKVKNAEEEDIQQGFVICSPEDPIHTCHTFDAQIVVLEYRSIICAGYSAIIHIHTRAEEVTLKVLIALIDKKTGEKSPRPRFIKQDQIAIVRLQIPGGMICMETYKDSPQMGRFTLRDEGKTIAVGKVLKIVD